MNKFLRIFTDPLWFCGVLLRRISPLIKNDETFIRWEYFFGMGRFPNLKDPQTFNEKLQWLKLHYHPQQYTAMVDKYEVKELILSKIRGGGQSALSSLHIIPTLGVWDRFKDIDFEKLPSQFVLKCTHDSGGLVICKDKAALDYEGAKRKINKSLRKNYFLEHREWPYKGVKPRIIAEQYMEDESGTGLKDYKFFCFDGEVKALFIATDRQTDVCFDFFDADGKHLPFTQGHPNAAIPPKLPENFDQMKAIAHELSQGHPHVRIDLYDIAGKIYFGEMTFYHFSGNVPFKPESWDKTFGDWLKLPEGREA